MVDARVKVTLPDHPKTRKLIRRCGQAGAWNLIRLFLFAAANRPDGDLSGMSSEDIELACDWQGAHGELTRALVEVRFLVGEEGAYRVHDWSDHNPWASGHEGRRERSKWANLVKYQGLEHAKRQMPDYASRIGVASEEDPSTVLEAPSRILDEKDRTPPFLSPLLSPYTLPEEEKLPQKKRDAAEIETQPQPAPAPPEPTPAPRKRRAPDQSTRIPDDHPSEQEIEWATTERPELDALGQRDRYRDHFKSAPGLKGRKSDWPATWRNWIRGAWGDRRDGRRQLSAVAQVREANQRILARIEANERSKAAGLIGVGTDQGDVVVVGRDGGDLWPPLGG